MDINGVSNSVTGVQPVRITVETERAVTENFEMTSNMENEGHSEEDIKKAVDKFNKVAEDDEIYAKYEMHDKFKQIMIKIIDKGTDEVLLEVPPKKILDMVAKMCEMVGILVDKKA